MTNFLVGIVIAVAFTLVAAVYTGDMSIAPAGILAGILASVTASETHDAQKAATQSDAPKQTVIKSFHI